VETCSHGGSDDGAVAWLVVLGVFDAAVAAGLLVLAGRWFPLLVMGCAAAAGGAFWLARRLTGDDVRP
jgi:hypothetical protein